LQIGFEEDMKAIIKMLPKGHFSIFELLHQLSLRLTERQAALFSATLSNSVRELARFSLTDPKYVGVDDKRDVATAEGLEQVPLLALFYTHTLHLRAMSSLTATFASCCCSPS
jgi:superfamily II DNA/RNA helicase